MSSESAAKQRLCTVWLVGDSTMSVKRLAKYPETGWGMPFAHFFAPEVRIENRAVNGPSTKRFLVEGRWAEVVSQLNPEDWVLVQFGHNDESMTRPTATTTVEFAGNLCRLVGEAMEQGAQPVLLTPVARRRFTSEGDVVDTHRYSSIVRRVASDIGVPLLDIDGRSRSMLAALGPDSSRLLFLHLAPGEHPNYPAGVADDTHLNELGARMVAQLVLAALQEESLALSQHVVGADQEASLVRVPGPVGRVPQEG